MRFFMEMAPPTATAQEKSVRIINGRPLFYEPKRLKDAKKLLMGHLMANKPNTPFAGAVKLTAVWQFPKGKSHQDGEWRVTRPDTDNLQKMLKDCMTQAGFWHDDAQVCFELVMKVWTDEPAGIFIEIEQIGKEGENDDV